MIYDIYSHLIILILSLNANTFFRIVRWVGIAYNISLYLNIYIHPPKDQEQHQHIFFKAKKSSYLLFKKNWKKQQQQLVLVYSF